MFEDEGVAWRKGSGGGGERGKGSGGGGERDKQETKTRIKKRQVK